MAIKKLSGEVTAPPTTIDLRQHITKPLLSDNWSNDAKVGFIRGKLQSHDVIANGFGFKRADRSVGNAAAN